MIKLKKEYLSIDSLVFLMANIFNAGIISLFLFIAILGYLWFALSYEQDKGLASSSAIIILILGYFVFITTKILSIPLILKKISSKSENQPIIDLMQRLKNNKKSLLSWLLGIEILINFLLALLNSLATSGNFMNILFNFVMFNALYLVAGAGLFGSYLSLFTGWKIKLLKDKT